MKSIILSIAIFFTVHSSYAQLNTIPKISETKQLTIGEVIEIESKKLNEKRGINIYIPEGYNPADSTRYPVIYLLDGGVNEDFIHIVGLVQFCSFEWVKQLPKSIVVGIANVDRKRDYTFHSTIPKEQKLFPTSGHANQFISFLKDELQPIIETKYKTTHSKTIIGESFGGLLATEILLKHPTMFNTYIIVSPSIWWDNASLLDYPMDVLQSETQQKTRVYIGVGKEGLTPSSKPRVMEVDANLLAEKLQSVNNKNLTLYFDYLPHEDHATIMHQAVLNAFKQVGKMQSSKD